ncbi:MAG: hypothetical protein HPM95_10845 [Alphaproteobacteria bacterium]|nr:hypothetical protein [Alphaproteobacteria bacterium]
MSGLAKAAASPTFVTDDESFGSFSPDGTRQSRVDVFAAQERLGSSPPASTRPSTGTGRSSEAIRLLEPSALTDPLTRWMLSAYTEFDTGAAIERLRAPFRRGRGL